MAQTATDSRVLMSTMRIEARLPMFGKHLAEGQVKCRWACQWDGQLFAGYGHVSRTDWIGPTQLSRGS